MKHFLDIHETYALPEAPLAMPKQQLETRRSWIRLLAETFAGLTAR